jgi:protein O-mannosyl-transferase
VSLLLQALALVALVATAYSGSLQAPFVFDDVPSVVQNQHLESLWPPGAFRSPSHVESSFAGRPVASYSLALSYALTGRDVAGYHAVQIALHALSACLLLAILRRTFAGAELGARVGEAAALLAFAAAALWALHPLLTEAVVYTSARSELLVALFTLAALGASLRVFAGEGSRFAWTPAAALAALLAVFSKENAASLPLVVLLYDRTFVSGGFGAALRAHRALHAALFASWLPLAALVAAGARAKTVGLGLGLSPLESLYTQAGVLLHYLALGVWPQPLRFVYDWDPVRSFGGALPELAIASALAAATAVGVLRRPLAAFAPACALLLLAPTTSVVPIVSELAAEKRMYLPLAPLVAAACTVGWLALREGAARLGLPARAAPAAAGVLAGALAVSASAATIARVAVYRTDLSLWTDALAKAPDHPWAHNNLGLAYRQRGDLAAAERHFRRALEIRPSLAPAWVNLGNLELGAGDLDGAIAIYRKAEVHMPDAVEVQYGLGLALARAGRIAEALPHFEAAVRISPQHPFAHVALARTYRRLGDAARAEREEAIGAELGRPR